MADLYVPLDVNAPDDPKILAAGDRAELVFYRALCLAKRLSSDGFIAAAQLTRQLGGVTDDAGRLVAVGLWAEVDGGWQIVSFLKRNPSAAALAERREAQKSRKDKWRARRDGPDDPADDRDADATRDSSVARRDRDVGPSKPATRSEVEVKRSEVKNPPGGALASSPHPDRQPRTDPAPAGKVAVAGYIADYRATHGGKSPPGIWMAQAGAQSKALLADGTDLGDIQIALGVCARENKSPKTLAHVLADLHSSRAVS
jgi:hypothetical protein